MGTFVKGVRVGGGGEQGSDRDGAHLGRCAQSLGLTLTPLSRRGGGSDEEARGNLTVQRLAFANFRPDRKGAEVVGE